MNRSSRPPLATTSRAHILLGVLAALLLASLTGPGTGGRPSAQTGGPCDPPNGNAVVCENQLAGNPSSEWDVSGSGDATIQGFATDISVNRGQTISFKVKTTSSNYRLDIYRMGYYAGLGARKVATVNPSAALPQTQPNCLTDAATGLVDCGNWALSASWAVPATATSGIYFAKATRIDTGGASHIIFIVRDDAGHSDLLFQTSDTTWQAYNQFGGNSLYVGGPGTSPGRAYKVSYNRPYTTRGTSPEDWVFNAEYPMVRFLESNGYNVAYASAVDTDRRGAATLQQHKVFMSVGHDEYWSATQRANVETARAAGVHLSFFSGNEVFWKTRFENSISSPATTYRTLVSYKETHAGAKIDPNAAWTGTWRDPRFSPPSDGGRPENALTGTTFMVNVGTAAIQVPAANGKMRFWRNTSIANLAVGAVATLPNGTLGFEWDEERDNGFRPAGLQRLSDTTVSGVDYLQDYGSNYASGTANHALTLYRHASGALVFGAGTVQWSWGLDINHDRGPAAASVPMKQATVNLFADMGAQPLTIQAGLTTASLSTDNLAPSSTILSPANGSTVPANATVSITGTAVDNGGGQIASVEVSIDGGATWHPAVGRSAWSYTWLTGGGRTVTIRSRVTDDSGNLEVALAGSTVTVGGGLGSCPCSIWSNASVPAVITADDPSAVELGTKFRADINGFITGIRFYKGPQNLGSHVGHLWTADGTSLASITFAGESASGWQQALFGAPVAITANTTYVVSYHSDTGFYSGNGNYFAASGVDNGHLHALRDGVDGDNGLYRYGAIGFPTETYESENYWVDVVFVTAVGPDTTAPVVSVVSPANGSVLVPVTTAVAVTFSEPVNPTSVLGTAFELRNAANVLVPATVTYAGQTATLQPSAPLNFTSTYSVVVRGGSTGVRDTAGNAMVGNFTWSFSTAATPPTIGAGGPILVVSSSANPFSQYYAEILRAEGMNGFTLTDLTGVNATLLGGYDVVILGNVPLTSAQVTMFTNWVTAGGNLIAMRPDKQLAGLLGLTDSGTTLADGYISVKTTAAPGAGIVGQTMQFHGTADRYTTSLATVVATLYSNATVATTSPAVTVRSVGSAGGQAAAFTYDLARSVVFTRQGNPAWVEQERDGTDPIRSNDLFFGGAQANYVDLTKVAIPQADEQQRLLANLVGFMNADRKPLPKFWYFPRGLKAVVVMTGDDHANNGTEGRFNIYNGNSPQGCSLADWECVRATSYIYPSTPLNQAAASAFVAQGFEIGVHITTNCSNYTPSSLDGTYISDLNQFAGAFPDLPAPRTNRTHCIPWSDYDTQPQVALANGIRLDTNYYYWPGSWVNNVPGLFTGSGMPMRFAKLNGTMIDVYQATTQMTDESEQVYPFTIDTLLDRALGTEGYYGAFVTNMHTDNAVHPGSEAIVRSAQLRGVPIVSAEQMLDWLDGRNNSSFGTIGWDGTHLSFTVVGQPGSNGLQTMLPATFGGHALTALTRNGVAASFSVQVVKGVAYAVFSSTTGSYAAEYAADGIAPTISGASATPSAGAAMINWTTNEPATSRVDFGTSAGSLASTATVSGASLTHAVSLTGLNLATTYYYRISSADLSGNVSTSPPVPAAPGSFTTPSSPYNCPCAVWPTQAPSEVTIEDPSAIELGLKWRSIVDGFVTGVRFYKGPLNTGAHVGNLWSSTGALLATATFAAESASGWQEVSFNLPVPVSANTTYVVSYHTDAGFYSFDGEYFQTGGTTNGPLVALANGVDGGNGLFRYGASGFPTGSFNGANYWVDLRFATDVNVNVEPPVVTAVTPVNGAANVAFGTPVTATFSQGLSAATVNPTTFQLRDAMNAPVNATVTYDVLSRTATLQPTAPLAIATTYTARLVGGANGIRDPWLHPLAADYVWSFTTQNLNVLDTTTADFLAGSGDAGVYVTSLGDGDIILTPSVAAEFAGVDLPAGWSVTPWSDGGTAVVANGSVTANGARVGLDALIGSGSVLEFKATFSGESYEHAGLGLTFNDTPFAMFSTMNGGALYARTHDGTNATNTLIPGTWLGSPHVYRIDWSAAGVSYFVDATLVASHPAVIVEQMRPLASNYGLGGSALVVDWVHVSPYATAATFTSRILAAGGTLNWTRADWTAAVPPSTTLSLSARFGDTSVPDASWTAYVAIPASGSAIAQRSRFVQYRVTLAGTGTETPVLQDVSFSGVMPPAPTVTIDDVTMNEGDSGSQNAVFTITSSYPSTSPVTVAYATANGTATAGSDYTAVTGTATIAADTTSITVSVPVAGDALVEPTETFTLNLSAPVNGVITDAQGTGTLVNDDQYQLSINNLTVTEGNTGSAAVTFTVTLSQAALQNITVNYATANGTAVAGADYTATSGVVTFTPGQLTRPIAVSVLGDTLDEADETFTVNLTTPVGAIVTSGAGAGTGTITDNDATPTLSIGNVTLTEANTGTTNAVLTVTLSAASGRTVTMNYATADVTAIAPGDYTATTGVLTFNPGTLTQQITVPVVGDTLDEPNETFNVNLTSLVNVTTSDPQGAVTITDNDLATATLSIGDSSVTEGDSGTKLMAFAVTLSAVSGQTVTASYGTTAGTASSAAGDYNAVSGTVTIPAGSTTGTINITIIGDGTVEANETFTVTLSSPANALLLDAQGIGTILNDDQYRVSIGNVTVTEGTGGTVTAQFTITLSQSAPQTVTVNYATANGTAIAGVDYTAASGQVTFAPGVTTRPVAVTVLGDALDEDNETFTVTLDTPVGAVISTGTATGTITDNDNPPTLTITNPTVAEGNAGSVNAIFTVTLSTASSRTITMNYATVAGTATAATDFTATSGILTFLPGSALTQQVAVAVLGDTLDEANETFNLALTNLTNVTSSDATGNGTITDDDPAVATISIADASVIEGNTGNRNLTFTVTLSQASGQTVSATYSTQNVTATGAASTLTGDYQTSSGTVTFPAGQTSQTINVLVRGETTVEPNETFLLNLAGLTNVIAGDLQAIGTILTDD